MIYYLYTIKLTHIWWLFYVLIASFAVPAAARRASVRIPTNISTEAWKVATQKIVSAFKYFRQYFVNYVKN